MGVVIELRPKSGWVDYPDEDGNWWLLWPGGLIEPVKVAMVRRHGRRGFYSLGSQRPSPLVRGAGLRWMRMVAPTAPVSSEGGAS